jgi:Gpi18-like mannosyltransferase
VRTPGHRLLAPAIVVGALAVGVALRAALVHGWNEDMDVFRSWLDVLQQQGARAFLEAEFRTNYTPLYLYALIAGNAVLPDSADELIIKWAPMALDAVTAFFAYRIVRLRRPEGWLPAAAFAAVLLAPTVVLNSAYWGQIDSMWAAPLLAGVYLLLVRRELWAFVAFGLALAIKAQAVFLLPLLLVLALRGRVRWRSFLVPPLVYLAVAVPALLAGKSLHDVLWLYREQSGYFGELTLNAPNPYQWIPERLSSRLSDPATAAAVLVVAVGILIAVRYVAELTDEVVLALAAASLLLVPFVLPHMHERYFYGADVFTIVLAFWATRWIAVAALVEAVSLLAYAPFLWDREPVPLPVLAVVETLALGLLLVNCVRLARTGAAVPQPVHT